MTRKEFSIPMRICHSATGDVLLENIRSKLIIHNFDLNKPYEVVRDEKNMCIRYIQETDDPVDEEQAARTSE